MNYEQSEVINDRAPTVPRSGAEDKGKGGNYELRIILVVVATLFGVLGTSGQQRRVIAGLEDNAEYRTLIAEEGTLVLRADSLAAGIASLRGRLRTDTLDRASISADIVRMEETGFEIRSSMARLATRINTIEQEWILSNLSAPRPDPTPDSDSDPGTLESVLTPEQLAELDGAQRAESDMPNLVEEYRENHVRLAALARDYELAASQGEADSIRVLFDDLRQAGDDLADAISHEWGMIFDSKSYIYNLMADKQNRRDLLALFEEGMERLREEQPRWQESGAPAAIADYLLQKRMLVGYEIVLAEESGDTASADSLRRVSATLPGPASLADLEPVVLRERLFLDYANITVGGSPYNSSNPIPEVAVWPRGVIWRVQLGNFTSRQPVSVFRGAHPLSMQRGDDGRFRYFAGGFPADSLAAAAVVQLRGAGFRSPAAVVWMDGMMIDPVVVEGEKIYRIEISGVDELSPALRDVISAADAGDIVRASGLFIVTPLDGPAAIRLRTGLEALEPSHPGMETKLSKIPE